MKYMINFLFLDTKPVIEQSWLLNKLLFIIVNIGVITLLYNNLNKYEFKKDNVNVKLQVDIVRKI